MDDPICWMNVKELIERYNSGELSPREVCQALCTRIRQCDSAIGAFTTLTFEEALRDAHGYTEELARGVRRGPLHGVPVAVKELFDVEGARTTFGSVLFRDRVAKADAGAVKRLRAAGAMIIGLTRSHEFGWGITTQHAQTGGTCNPWDRSRVPGGSSGGSAAAIALGMAPAALASDTGGSIRIPAGYCGVAGLKPTYGRISKAGAVPLAPSLDHPGFITRDVTSLGLLFSAVAGYDPDDPTTSADLLPALDQIDEGIAGLRIGLARASHQPQLRPDHEFIFQCAVDAVSHAGGRISEMQVPAADKIRSVFDIMQRAEAYHVHATELGTFPARADEYGADVRSRLEMAARVSLAQYLDAQHKAAQIRRQFEVTFAAVDVLLTPVAAGGPSCIAEPDSVDHLGVKIPFRDLVMNYTVPQNITGFPACAVRAGFDNDGLPVAVQVTARAGREDLALRVARSLEQILGGFTAPPSPLVPVNHAASDRVSRSGTGKSSPQARASGQ
jgi:aspartyl-tRNA(Asn)/glutamyl-tRNA(Gln) amidotransferase subunit A